QQRDRQAVSLQLPHGAAIHRQAGEGSQVAGAGVQTRGHRGRAARVYAAMGSLHEVQSIGALPLDTGTAAMSDVKPSAVDGGLYLELQRFLYREAALLDRREYGAWLALMTEDVHYRVTASVARDGGAAAVEDAIIEEKLTGLKSRIDQISNPRLTRAENP